MFFNWLRRLRRRRIARRPFPDEWLQIVRSNVAHYHLLTADEQIKICHDLRILVAEKNWEGCGGLVMNDEIKVTVAAMAALLVLGFDGEYFETVQSILVYPDAYVVPQKTVIHGGVVMESEEPRSGEAWYRGPVVLTWSEVLAGGAGDTYGSNLVLHEFSHQLDMQNGHEADGVPPLHSRDKYQQWERVMAAEHDSLIDDCQDGRSTLLDCYGTLNRAEFFAVSTECFFGEPQDLSYRHPELYEVLCDYYRQDPATRA